MLAPFGFYFGWLDHGYAHSLYADNLPRGVVTQLDNQPREIVGWGELAAPFPNERRLLRQHFRLTALVGEKLHLFDPRGWLDDQYVLMTASGERQLSAVEFFRPSDGAVVGIGADSMPDVFKLSKAGARMLKRSEESMIYAIEIPRSAFSPELMKSLAGLPNLEQIQLSETSVSDEDLQCLHNLQRLEAIGLYGTAITNGGVNFLKTLPAMKTIQIDPEIVSAGEK